MSSPESDIQVYNQADTNIPLEEPCYLNIATLLAENENASFSFVEVVYVGEEEIVRINQEHLDRDYVTDIITFRYDDANKKHDIEGTMFCCAPRIVEQANEFGESPTREFMRIYIHGLLHLIGYEDTSEELKKKMTSKEDTYLKLAE